MGGMIEILSNLESKYAIQNKKDVERENFKSQNEKLTEPEILKIIEDCIPELKEMKILNELLKDPKLAIMAEMFLRISNQNEGRPVVISATFLKPLEHPRELLKVFDDMKVELEKENILMPTGAINEYEPTRRLLLYGWKKWIQSQENISDLKTAINELNSLLSPSQKPAEKKKDNSLPRRC